jgi:hypothetical protein
MNRSDCIISINGIHDKKMFFSSLLNFFAPLDVILSLWGKVPKTVLKRLSIHKVTDFGLRRFLFHELNLKLNNQSLSVISDCLCDDEILDTITWGIHTGNIPLAHAWDWDDMNIDGSGLIQDEVLLSWINKLKANGIIESFERIDD